MDDIQKLDYILANMATKADIAGIAAQQEGKLQAIQDALAELESDILTEVDRGQRMCGNHFDSMAEQIGALEKSTDIFGLVYNNVKHLRISLIELQSRLDLLDMKIS